MQFPRYGLRAGILTQLVFLIIAAMLLINVAMIKFWERDLINEKLKRSRSSINALEHYTARITLREESSSRIRNIVGNLFPEGDYRGVVVVDKKGDPVFKQGMKGELLEIALQNACRAMKAGMYANGYHGRVWGVLWPNHRDLLISQPFSLSNPSYGAVTVVSSLEPLYETLRQSEKIVLLYILLDAIVLAVAGIYLISRIAVNPIHRLLKMTEAYKEGDVLPSISETSKNEIGQLTLSLANMLKRLDDNKNELEAHIRNLENTNEELQKAQSEIIRSEKLASVGRLAAGIAHEIGNPLGISLGYLGIIRKGEIDDEDEADFLNRIETEILRINSIIKQLLDFSRPASGISEQVSVHQLIEKTIDMLKPQPMMEGIGVELELEAVENSIRADPNQVQQVLVNILINAADVFAEEGLQGDRPKKLVIKSRTTAGDIEIRFMDNGPGIPPEQLDHIFDPFYTTKEPGKGTGLGLSVCYRIIEELDGRIYAESEPGQGTTIVVRLPLSPSQTGGPEYD